MSDDKLIYQCPTTGRYYDPLAVKRAVVQSSRGRFNDAVAERNSEDPVKRADAEAVLVAAARAGLGLAAIDPATGRGVTDAAALDALTAFTKWASAKKVSGQTAPGSTPCSGCP